MNLIRTYPSKAPIIIIQIGLTFVLKTKTVAIKAITIPLQSNSVSLVITINTEKLSTNIPSSTIDYAIKRWRHVEIRKRDGVKLKIPNAYFIVSKDIESFVNDINSITEKNH